MVTDSAHPEQRQVPARIYTPSGWITGTFHVLKDQPFLQYLNGAGGFFTLTDVTLPGQTSTLGFLALQRAAAIVVVPAEADLIDSEARASARTEVHVVSCLFEGGLLMGSLALPEDVRVSDELMAARGFLVVHQCTIGIDRSASKPMVEAAAVAIVQASRIVGVAEM